MAFFQSFKWSIVSILDVSSWSLSSIRHYCRTLYYSFMRLATSVYRDYRYIAITLSRSHQHKFNLFVFTAILSTVLYFAAKRYYKQIKDARMRVRFLKRKPYIDESISFDVEAILGHGAFCRVTVVKKHDKILDTVSKYAVKIVSRYALPPASWLEVCSPKYWFKDRVGDFAKKEHDAILHFATVPPEGEGSRQLARMASDRLFFITDLTNKESVGAFLRRNGPMRKRHIRVIAAQVLHAILTLHEQDMTLGDLSPETIYVDPEGEVSLLTTDVMSVKVDQTWKLKDDHPQAVPSLHPRDFNADFFHFAACLVSMVSCVNFDYVTKNMEEVLRQRVRPETPLYDLIRVTMSPQDTVVLRKLPPQVSSGGMFNRSTLVLVGDMLNLSTLAAEGDMLSRSMLNPAILNLGYALRPPAATEVPTTVGAVDGFMGLYYVISFISKPCMSMSTT